MDFCILIMLYKRIDGHIACIPATFGFYLCLLQKMSKKYFHLKELPSIHNYPLIWSLLVASGCLGIWVPEVSCSVVKGKC